MPVAAARRVGRALGLRLRRHPRSRRGPAGKLGATTYLVPPLAVLLGWLLLGEAPPALAFVGGALGLVGVAVTRGLIGRRRLAPA